jgi:hypothetical protein
MTIEELFAALTPGALTIIGEQLTAYCDELDDELNEHIKVKNVIECIDSVIIQKTDD